MTQDDSGEKSSAERAVSVLDECVDIIFENAPVMMHSVSKDGRLVKVNRRWTEVSGYQPKEAFGRKSIDFLTEESRARAVKETLPLFWRVGSARSVGYQFVRKDGGVVDLLLDAEVGLGNTGTERSYAALYEADITQWKQACRSLRDLKALNRAKRKYESARSPDRGDVSNTERLERRQLPDDTSDLMNNELVTAFHELAQDASVNLRAIARVQEELAGAIVEHQSETRLVLKSIDRTLANLADAVAAAPRTSK